MSSIILEEELRHMYLYKKMTVIEIADKYGVGQSTIIRRMKKCGIKSRGRSKLGGLIKPLKEDLEEMYYNKEMSVIKIADKYGVGQSTVIRWMKKNDIKSRSCSERVSGKKNGNWKDGISFGTYCKKFNNMFKESVRERDGYICQLCGSEQWSNGRKLDVHHVHYDKKNCYPDVVSLCRSCNSSVNADRDYWENYFVNHLIERGLSCWSVNIGD